MNTEQITTTIGHDHVGRRVFTITSADGNSRSVDVTGWTEGVLVVDARHTSGELTIMSKEDAERIHVTGE